MRHVVQILDTPYIYFTPENDGQFEAILDLTRMVHGEGAVALSRSLDLGMPGMTRDDWYGLARLEDWPEGRMFPLRVVSTLCRVPTNWTCSASGIEVTLPSAELGMVASAEDTRGLGLSSWLMKRFKQDSIRAGFILSTIQGIPYYYRRFGYEYAVPLLPKIVLRPGQALASETPATTMPKERLSPEHGLPGYRKATGVDIPQLASWYNEMSKGLGIRADRSLGHWEFLMGKAQSSFETAVDRYILLDAQGRPSGYLGFQQDCFGPTLAIAEASIPGPQGGPSAQAMLALAESFRARAGLPHLTVLLPHSHPLVTAAIGLGGDLCREYAWQVSILDLPAFFDRLRPVLETRLALAGWGGQNRDLLLDLYGDCLYFNWGASGLEILLSSRTDPSRREDPRQNQEASRTGRPQSGQPRSREPGTPPESPERGGEGEIDTMPEIEVSSFPPELLGPLVLGYRSWQELGHCRRDVMIRPGDRAFMDVLFPSMDTFIYPQF